LEKGVRKTLIYPGNNNQAFTVIGIAEDFNIQNLHSPMSPFALFHSSSKSYQLDKSYTLIKTSPGSEANAIDQVRKIWNSFTNDSPFDYSFLDSVFDSQYRSEQRLGKVFGLFTALSLFIACLGLFGLASFTAEKRSKEVSIRKTLGASVTGIVTMLSKDFLKPVIISALIAFPIAWIAMNSWLNDFAYRTEIKWQVFLLSALTGIIIALITVGYQAMKSANANPVINLRNE
jgi:putative ABC transport system permease protein